MPPTTSRDFQRAAQCRAFRFAANDRPISRFADDTFFDRVAQRFFDMRPAVNQSPADDDLRNADAHNHIGNTDAEVMSNFLQSSTRPHFAAFGARHDFDEA